MGSLTGMGGRRHHQTPDGPAGRLRCGRPSACCPITVFAMSIVSVGKQIAQKGPRSTSAPPSPWPWAAWPARAVDAQAHRGLRPLRIWSPWYQNASAVRADPGRVPLYAQQEPYQKHVPPRACAVGAGGRVLGICSSFLGIGGGPINVALIIYLFGRTTPNPPRCALS